MPSTATQTAVSAPIESTAPALPFSDAAHAQALMQTFARMRAQEQQLQAQTRAQMLGALSPTHHALVATLVGQLAVAPNPDGIETARQLDATLSSSEQRAVLRVNAGALAQAQTIALQMASEFKSQLTPEQRSAMQRQSAKMKADLEQLSPEQRAVMQRQAAQVATMGLPALVGTLGSPSGFAQDAGSVLLRTLTTPNGMTSGNVNADAVRLQSTKSPFSP